VVRLLVRTVEHVKQALQVKDTAVYVTQDSRVTTVNLILTNARTTHTFAA